MTTKRAAVRVVLEAADYHVLIITYTLLRTTDGSAMIVTDKEVLLLKGRKQRKKNTERESEGMSRRVVVQHVEDHLNGRQ